MQTNERKIIIVLIAILAMAAFILLFPWKKESDDKNRTSTDDTVSLEEEDEADDEEPASFEVLTENKPTTINIGDIDKNGITDCAVFTELSLEGKRVYHLDLYLNDEIIYSYEDSELPFDIEKISLIDLDNDGGEELFIPILPHVNSMPLTQFTVLKNFDGKWAPLESFNSETGITGFPIKMIYGKATNSVDISMEGIDYCYNVDLVPHYVSVLSDFYFNEDEYNAEKSENALFGNAYEDMEDFGSVAPWGTWTVAPCEHMGTNCLKAVEGILGYGERSDMLGTVNVYFNYNPEGKIQVMNFEFEPDADDKYEYLDKKKYPHVLFDKSFEESYKEVFEPSVAGYIEKRMEKLNKEFETNGVETRAKYCFVNTFEFQNTGTAGLTDAVELYRVEYGIIVDGEIPENMKNSLDIQKSVITENEETGSPFFCFCFSEKTKGEYKFIRSIGAKEIFEKYGTKEMLDEYGDKYIATAMELYKESGYK